LIADELPRRKAEERPAIGRFGHEHVGFHWLGTRDGEAAAELEVAGVKQCALGPRDMKHGTAEHVTGRQELDARVGVELVRDAIVEFRHAAQADAVLR
jgi:hypothetical protein